MTKKNIKSLTLLTAIGVACAGCHHGSDWEPSEPDNPSADPEMLTLKLDVSYAINGLNPTTRAEDTPDYYEPESGDFEKVSSLRVIIVRAIEGEQGIVEANRMVATADNGHPLRDNMEFEVIANEEKRVYLVANEWSITSAPTGYDTASSFLNSFSKEKKVDLGTLANWTVTNPITQISDDTTEQGLYSDIREGITPRLPQTEWFNISTACDSTDLKNINPDGVYFSELFITRTAAKATFFVDQENSSPTYDNVKITALTLKGIGSEEYLFPRDTEYSPAKYPDGNNHLQMQSAWSNPTSEVLEMYITKFTTPRESKPLTYLKQGLQVPVVNKNAAENTEREIFGPVYFAESILEKDEFYEVGVQLSTGVWLRAPLKKTETDQANILNIDGREAVARNTHLKITLRFTPTNLEAEATVFPYTAVNLNPSFGFIIPVESVTISARSQETGKLEPIETIELREGDSKNLIGTTLPENANNQDLVWMSGDPTIVTVSDIGMVTAKTLPDGMTEATVSISAMAADGSGKSATCMVTVKPKILVESITVSPTSWTGNIGTTTRLMTNILPLDATVQEIEWTSDNIDVAIVSSYGIVTAMGPGSAIITARTTDGSGKSATCSVHVNDIIKVTSLTLSAGPSGAFYEGEQFSFNATVLPNDATNKDITWTSSDNSVATVTNYGLVTAVKEGEVTITATAADGSGHSASRSIKVSKLTPVTGIAISKGGNPVTAWTTTFTTPNKQQYSVRATISPAGATYRGVRWTSSNEKVATVSQTSTSTDATGKGYSIANIIAQGRGTAVITATSMDNPEVSATVLVTVN